MDKRPSGFKARWKARYHHASIQLILSIAFTAVAVIGMLFLGMALLLRFSSSANEMAAESSQRVLAQVNWNLDSYLRNMMRVSDTVYYRVIKSADLEQSDTAQELRDALKLLYAKDRDVLVSLAVFDGNGELISATPLTELKNSVTPSREGWFTAAMERIENLHYSTPHVQHLFDVIGLDLGGTNSVFGIVDARGEIKATTAIKTGGYEKVEDYVKAAVEALQPIIDTVGGIDKIKAMGIGAPNANYYNGTIEFAPNLPWAHDGVVPLADLFSKALGGLPVGMTNDANAAALGEMTYGVARGMKNFIDVTLGTGVGSGIVINGQMVYGCDGFAGELGHVTMVRGKEGRICGCGRTGCLEAYCSATGVARTAREFLEKSDEPSLLREMNPEDITSYDVSVAAGKGDKLALRVYEFTGKMLGEACADFAAFSSPEAFVFFGGLTKAGDLIMKPIQKAYDEHVLRTFKGKAKFLVSTLDGSSAAVLGASAVAWDM